MLKAETWLPDLTGWRVIFVGLGDTAGTQPALTPPLRRLIVDLWTAICTASGAAECIVDKQLVSAAPPTGPEEVEPGAGERSRCSNAHGQRRQGRASRRPPVHRRQHQDPGTGRGRPSARSPGETRPLRCACRPGESVASPSPVKPDAVDPPAPPIGGATSRRVTAAGVPVTGMLCFVEAQWLASPWSSRRRPGAQSPRRSRTTCAAHARSIRRPSTTGTACWQRPSRRPEGTSPTHAPPLTPRLTRHSLARYEG